MNSKFWIIFSGSLWITGGLILLSKGIHLLFEPASAPLINSLHLKVGSAEQAAFLLFLLSLGLGMLKARLVIKKTAMRILTRLHSLGPKISLFQAYRPRDVLLIGSMVLLGISLRFFHLPADIHGMIDVAIGTALLNSSLVYFRNLEPQT